jgi:hypothetical protein
MKGFHAYWIAQWSPEHEYALTFSRAITTQAIGLEKQFQTLEKSTWLKYYYIRYIVSCCTRMFIIFL